MQVIKVKDYAEMSEKACEWFVGKLKEMETPVLGLATGSTPEGLYDHLIQKYKDGEISFQDVKTFNLDEYIGLAGDNPNSYRYFMNEKLFNNIDIKQENTFVPNGVATDLEKECTDYEQLIKDAGGIDIQLLGIGSNGHIGFNEPGAKFDGRTHIENLAQATIDANARFFDSMDDVPKQAVTMGIGSIIESKEILLLASGENKADAIAGVIDGELTEALPASILKQHPRVTIIADEAALAKVK
ncbi:glucosamine-6-phosphate deaminase [Ornithinibacillus gellani]|uniref:glucosamine-6-phosphate deaminase n=1 Tax=Ornithinibacillus gellani TaxID=2293253 RepID=UPI000F48D1D1|nr:glucosamine-6-phosphate deaminase [Ornithinibacillus gellani]TQS74841.1 glucosamine-6-phosphate deaminase [Ornithinibacillus gellani]